MTYRFGFAMAQVAGHVTHGKNLRRVADQDPAIETTWCEVSDYRPDGRLEQLTNRLGRGQALRPMLDMFGGLRRPDVDAMLVNTPLIGLYPRRVLDAPIMIDFDSTPTQLAAMPEYGITPSDGATARVWGRVKQRLWDRAELFQAWSQWAKESAVNDDGLSADRIIVNPPGVDLDLWTPAEHTNEALATRPLRLLFVGGDFDRKGGDLLLEWYRRTRPADVELHFVTRQDIPPVDGVSVHHGLTANSDRLVDLYRHSDVFVLPTRAECFGIATVEAMASGLPVVVGDVGASSEIVDHGVNGLLVTPGDIDSLDDAISTILGDDQRRSEMAAASRRIAETKFSVQRNATRTLTEMKRLADRRVGAA